MPTLTFIAHLIQYFKMPRDKPINLSVSERKLVYTYSIFLLVFILVVRAGIEPVCNH